MTRVFKTGTLYATLYILGFGIPLCLVLSLYIISIIFDLQPQPYLRFYQEFSSPLCWLNESYMWVVLAYVGMVAAFNVSVTVRAVVAAYNSAKFRFFLHLPFADEKLK